MPFEDKENLTDLKTFTDSVYFNDDVYFYGNVVGLPQSYGLTNPDGSDTTNITINENNNINITVNSNDIVVADENYFTIQTTAIVQQIFENVNLSSFSLTGTVDVDILTGTLFYYTDVSSSNWTFNIRGDSSNTLNSILETGKSVTVTILTTQGGTAYYANTFKIDGITVTPKWQLGVEPSTTYTSSINIYTYVILKTADSTFTVLGTFTKFE